MEISRARMDQTEALYQQAVTALRSAAPAEAASLLHQAIRIAPKLAILHDALGTALMTQGQAKQAITRFKTACTLQPELVSAWYNLGLAREAIGQADKAEAAYLHCLQLAPGNASASNNLGNIYRQQAQPGKAIACYQQALETQPDLAPARTNLAMAHTAQAALLQDQGDAITALPHFEQAVALEPGNPAYHFNLGCGHAELGQFKRAIASYQQALTLDPKHPDAHSNTGLALRQTGDIVGALEYYQQALANQPDNPKAMQNLAFLLRRAGHSSKAIEYLDRALLLDPDNPALYSERGSALKDQGRLPEAIVALRKAVSLTGQRPEIHSNLLLALNYAEPMAKAELFADHCRFEHQLTAGVESAGRSVAVTPGAGRKLRIGYLSADLRMHSVSYFLEPVLAHHDHDQFEIFAYYNERRLDSVSDRLKSCCDVWREVAGLADDQLAALIRRDRIDILIDLSGHSGGNRLAVFARRVAPVQISWLGYPNTTGLTGMDYRITDEYTDPGAEQGQHYSEELLRLPHHFCCYRPPDDYPEVATPPCKTNGQITFGSFNNLAKLSLPVLATWAGILDSIPDSRLLLKTRALADQATAERIHSCFRDLGIETERVILKARDLGKSHHLERYAELDIALDPFPYNGTTTTCEALWMGVPVIALKGDTHRGRVSASMVAGLGLQELVAGDHQQYIAIATALAADRGRLQVLRAGMRERLQGSALLDESGFTGHLETALKSTWARAVSLTV